MRVIVTGGGQIARRLSLEGNEVTIVEPDPGRCRELEEQLDVKVVQGNAARVRTMRKAGVRDAEMLIAVTNSDEVNVLARPAAASKPARRTLDRGGAPTIPARPSSPGTLPARSASRRAHRDRARRGSSSGT